MKLSGFPFRGPRTPARRMHLGVPQPRHVPIYDPSVTLVAGGASSSLTAHTAWIVSRGSAIMELSGGYSLTTTATKNALNGVVADLPALLCTASTGAQSALTLPAPALVATGTVTVVGRVDVPLPALTLVANGKAGGISTAYLQHGGAYSVEARTGARAVVALEPNGYALASSGTTGGIASAALSIAGAYVVSAGGNQEAIASADMVLPSLQAAPSGQAWLVGPSLTMHAVAQQVIAVAYEAYAINLATGAVTHYTNYPFDNILRFGNKFYGVSSAGLFEIGGDLDLAVPIAARIKTFQTTFGSQNKKRLPAVYSSGRSDGGVTIGVTADEGTTYEYTSDWGEVPGNTNHRTVPGKGINGVYYSLEVKNVAGGSLELDTISVEVAHTTRAI